jgi:hypothetical protein
MQFCKGSDKGTALNCVQISKMCDGDPGNDQTSVRGRKPEPYVESPNSVRPKKGETGEKSRACSPFSLPSRRLFTENLSWQAKQSILHTIVIFYSDCMKMCKESPNFGGKRTGCHITTTYFLFHQEIFYEKQHDCRPPPIQHFSASLIEDKTEKPLF